LSLKKFIFYFHKSTITTTKITVETEVLGVKPPRSYQIKMNKKMTNTKIDDFLNGQTGPIWMKNSP